MKAMACARTVKAIAAAIALPLLSGCAGLHLDQGPDQVIQRTEGEDNYDLRGRRPARSLRASCPTPAGGAIIRSSGLSNSQDRARGHRMRRRRTEGLRRARRDQRAARWLHEWRYVWSCNGPDECGAQTAGQGERVADGLGVQIWARKGVRCPEAVIAFRGTVGGNKGDWESNFHWILRAFPIYDQYEQVRDHVGDFIGHIERDSCYRKGATEIIAVGHSLGGGLAQLAAYSDRRSGAFTPSIPRW